MKERSSAEIFPGDVSRMVRISRMARFRSHNEMSIFARVRKIVVLCGFISLALVTASSAP